MEVVLKSEYHESPLGYLGYDNVDWLVNEVIKSEYKMVFYLKNTKKDINLTKKDGEDYGNINICRFCEEILNVIKLEIVVTRQVITEVQLKVFVILM